ncbi:hypothetical protein KBD20_00775 [Candidatus Saccharibacteria bacterium]|nr:hypothetical protein [Candidatus Saccharibacteria bacterium]
MESSDIEHEYLSGSQISLRSLILRILPLLLTSSVIILLLVTSRPTEGGPIIVLGMLALVFLLFVQVLSLGLGVVAPMFGFSLSPSRVFLLSVILSVGGVFLVGLQTLNQLSVTDVILVILLEVMANFYIARRF